MRASVAARQRDHGPVGAPGLGQRADSRDRRLLNAAADALSSLAVMAASDLTRLDVRGREPGGSRGVRRPRREGFVPGVLYGGSGDPVSFSVDARALRHALA